MPNFKTDTSLSALFSVVMAPGMVPDSYGPYEPGHYVVSNTPEVENWRGKDEALYRFHVYGFGALMSGAFPLHIDAEKHAQDIKYDPSMPLDYSQIDIGSIDCKNFAARMFNLEMTEVEFSPREYDMLPLIGAIDQLEYGEKNQILSAFPNLKGYQINEPEHQPYDTHDGNFPKWREEAYVILSDEKAKLLEAAQNKSDLERIAAMKAAYPGNYYPRALHAVAEEIGKDILKDPKQPLRRIFKMRAYSYEETSEPVVPPGQVEIIQDALKVIEEKPASTRDAILSGIRGYSPQLKLAA